MVSEKNIVQEGLSRFERVKDYPGRCLLAMRDLLSNYSVCVNSRCKEYLCVVEL
jgi:hypothetical protein